MEASIPQALPRTFRSRIRVYGRNVQQVAIKTSRVLKGIPGSLAMAIREINTPRLKKSKQRKEGWLE